MPSIQNGDATIYYEVYCTGFPILTFAPGGLLSSIEVWSRPSAPLNPTIEFASNFQVIAMDQRNAPGSSRAPIRATDNWDTFTSDHIAVLDHLGIEQCHLYGQCIGGPFIFNLLKRAPERVVAAVIAQPIGRVGELTPGRSASFAGWVETLQDHPEATDDVLDAFYLNLYAPGLRTRSTAISCARARRRASCSPATTPLTPSPSPRRSLSSCPTPSSSRNGSRASRSSRRRRA